MERRVQWSHGTAGIDYPLSYIIPEDENQQSFANSPNSPTKRSFLRDCITEMYVLKSTKQPIMEYTVDFNKTRILSMLNELLLPVKREKMTTKQASIERAKRQLFRKPQKSRKSRKPTKNWGVEETQGFHFKAIRKLLGVKYLSRNYQRKARDNIIEGGTRTNLKRKFDYNEFDSYFDGEDCDSAEKTFAQICKIHCNAEREFQLRDAARRDQCTRLTRANKMMLDPQSDHLRYVNEMALEESVRSIYYLKALIALTIDSDETVYI